VAGGLRGAGGRHGRRRHHGPVRVQRGRCAWQRCLGGDLAEAESFRCSGSVWPRNLSAFPADFDADGAADLLLFDRATGAWTRATSDGVGVTITETPGAWPAGNWQVVPGDFDGDGRSSDFLLYDQETGNVRLELDSGSGFEASAGQAAWSPGWQVLAGDFNADGRTDVLLYAAGQGRTSVGLTGQAGDFGWTSETLPADASLLVRDLNDDDAADVVAYKASDGTVFTAVSRSAQGGHVFQIRTGNWGPGWRLLAPRQPEGAAPFCQAMNRWCLRAVVAGRVRSPA